MNRTLPLATVLMILLTCGSAALATAPRLDALGSAGDYLEDDASAPRWIGSLGDHDDAVTLDFGHFNIYTGYHDDQDRRVSGPGLIVSRRLGERWGVIRAEYQTVENYAPTGSLYRDRLEENYGLIFSRLIGPVQAGVSYRRLRGDRERLLGDLNIATVSLQQEIGLGLRLDLNSGAYLDVAGQWRATSEEFTAEDEFVTNQDRKLESDGSLGLRARVFLRLGERTALVPVAEYLGEDRPAQPQSFNFFPALDGRVVRLGCGLDFFPDTDRLLLVAADFLDGHTDYSFGGTVGGIHPPWTHDWNAWSLLTGWETRYLPWLTLRGSVGYRLARSNDVPAAVLSSGTSLDYDDLFYTLGAGLHLGRWDLDAALSEQEPQPVFGDWGATFNGYRTTWLSVAVRRGI